MQTVTTKSVLQRRIWRLSLIEWLIAIAIVGVVASLLFPTVQWISDGSIEIPVRILVFDAADGKPVPGARVVIVRTPPLADDTTLDDISSRFSRDIIEFMMHESTHATADDGTVVIRHEFTTNASNRNPTRRAHLQNAWVIVLAEGYGGVVVPVGHDSQSTETLHKPKELLVPVGLLPAQ